MPKILTLKITFQDGDHTQVVTYDSTTQQLDLSQCTQLGPHEFGVLCEIDATLRKFRDRFPPTLATPP